MLALAVQPRYAACSSRTPTRLHHGFAMSDRPVILHIAADFPNIYRPVNTLAVRNFVDLNPEAEHLVYAVTRTADPRKAALEPGDGQGREDVVSVRYWGLPGGANLPQSMAILARRIHAHLMETERTVDIIHAHKLTFEGLAARTLSQLSDVPYVCSARGEAEIKTLSYLPFYRPLFRKTAAQARMVYLVSAWVRDVLQDKLGLADEDMRPLPNFVHLPQARTAFHFNPDRLICLAHLEVYEKKGVPELLEALARVVPQHPQVQLEIYGRTPPDAVAAVNALVAQHQLEDHVTIAGLIDHATLMEQLPSYAAMVLVSKNETFGMSYAEALYSGVPILYSRGTGVDGFVDGVEAAVGADPNDLDSIEAGLRHILEDQQALRANLINSITAVRQRFEPEPFLRDYNALVRAAIAEHRAAAA